MSRRNSLRADWLNGNVKALRAQYERAFRAPVCGLHAWRKIDARSGSIRILVHGELSNANAAILYFHGGGWIVGSPSTHADITGDLHAHAGLPVISVDYRLAPENRVNAAIDDGLTVLRHVLAGVVGRAILCGDSAGAPIALAVERHSPADMRRHIAGVGSFYGAFRSSGGNLPGFGSRENGLDRACLRRYWVLANGSREMAPFSFSSLAQAEGSPVYVLAGGRDPLRDDSLALARALTAAGRKATLHISRFADHGFLHRAHRSSDRDSALRRFSSWVRGLLPS